MKHLKDRLQHIAAWWKWAWILSGIEINGRKKGFSRLEIAYRRALHHQREPRFGAEPVTRNWESDFSHENGNYRNNCVDCGHDFTGHKRRHLCNRCSWESRLAMLSLSPKDREELLLLRLREIQAFFNPPTDEQKKLARAATGYRSTDPDRTAQEPPRESDGAGSVDPR